MAPDQTAGPPAAAETDVAIIGMAGRFPGADDVDEFWSNLRQGVESIRSLSDDELREAGVAPEVFERADYVRAQARLSDVGHFDAEFFGYSPREAEITDPQHRILLECAWQALESAGYASESDAGRIGVYAGASFSSYLLFNLYPNPHLRRTLSHLQILAANDKDYLTTRISYKLNLKGPSVTVQTASSTSLVAVHMACQSLLGGECDVALAGGVSITVPENAGYLYQEGGIQSPDGHCRPFDSQAAGTVFGNGVGLVVLKRLEDALSDGDVIDAVIKGSALNNDGSFKIGYLAPSIEGQADVIREALAVARVDPATVGYVETHGTGTPLGDPIEIAALREAYGAVGERCYIGSLKSNVGHLDVAAGVAGLIKTVLALKHRELPATLHFREPNPELDLASSPFRVVTELRTWRSKRPRRAGVSCFGFGGTNVHLILEEAPQRPPSGPSREWQLLPLSARSRSALDAASETLARYLQDHPDVNLADLSYTLTRGRRTFAHRQLTICRDHRQARQDLRATRLGPRVQPARDRPVVFMFPGQGTQHAGMGADLYEREPCFRAQVDRCDEVLEPHLGCRFADLLQPAAENSEATRWTDRTELVQPALFVIEYALARLWMSWGVQPRAMIGHSLGEYVAACLAGVFSLEDALGFVAWRGRLMQSLPTGAMLSVPLAEDEVRPLLGDSLSLAAVNGPSLCVVSGPARPVVALEEALAQRSLDVRRLHTSHAFHSAMLDPIVQPCVERLRRLTLRPPKIQIVSNVTGLPITEEQATAPEYWGEHLRRTVLFSAGIAEATRDEDRILLEVGPGRTLSTLAEANGAGPPRSHPALPSLGHHRSPKSESLCLLEALAELWLCGVRIDWSGFWAHQQRRRLRAPTYHFERKRFWIDPPGPSRSRQGRPGDRPARPEEPPPSEQESGLEGRMHPRPSLTTSFVPPTTRIQRIVASAWQEVLGIERVGVDDNFFELGGHSLMATRLVTLLNAELPVQVPLRGTFEADTVAKMADVIEELLLQRVEGLTDAEAERILSSSRPGR